MVEQFKEEIEYDLRAQEIRNLIEDLEFFLKPPLRVVSGKNEKSELHKRGEYDKDWFTKILLQTQSAFEYLPKPQAAKFDARTRGLINEVVREGPSPALVKKTKKLAQDVIGELKAVL